jgi:hypothetical protein
MVLTPLPGSYVRIDYATGADSTYSNEAMSEVNLLATEGRARYTVYRITDATKRCLNDSAVPVFEKQVHGSGGWSTLTPTEIWYGAGYIICAVLNNDDLVRCASGKYQTPLQLFGCVSRSFNDKTQFADITCFGDTAEKRFPTIDDWDAKVDAFFAHLKAFLLTSGGAADSHIYLDHTPGGTGGNDVSLEMTNPGGSAALTVTVASQAITVALGVSGGTITSTAAQVVAALNANVDVQALGVRAWIAPGELGSGLVAVLAHTHLASGREPIDFTSMIGTRMLFWIYNNYTAGAAHVGFAYLESIDWTGNPADVIKMGMSYSGHGYPMRRVAT